jgi:hypothetical protein
MLQLLLAKALRAEHLNIWSGRKPIDTLWPHAVNGTPQRLKEIPH